MSMRNGRPMARRWGDPRRGIFAMAGGFGKLAGIMALPALVAGGVGVAPSRTNGLAQAFHSREIWPQRIERLNAFERDQHLDPAGRGIANRQRRRSPRVMPRTARISASIAPGSPVNASTTPGG